MAQQRLDFVGHECHARLREKLALMELFPSFGQAGAEADHRFILSQALGNTRGELLDRLALLCPIHRSQQTAQQNAWRVAVLPEPLGPIRNVRSDRSTISGSTPND